ncbi:hypothetical protein [Amphibiibacter pelophylacis]|uniref:Uncharacterized protein n=1 Tax=Amphibiibacter pelophylacis TaxID=1799477 RepID=A0ACC6P1Z0_9BURK
MIPQTQSRNRRRGTVAPRTHSALLPVLALLTSASLTAWAAPADDDLAIQMAPLADRGDFPPPQAGVPLVDPAEAGLPRPGPLVAGTAPSPSNAPIRVPRPADPAQFTLMSQFGRLMTAWSRRPNEALWGYFPRDTASGFDDLREWTMEPGTRPGRVRIRNVQLGSCIGQRDSSGETTRFPFPFLAQDKAFCRDERGDFSLLPVSGGGFVLQSRFTGQCVRLENTDMSHSSRWARAIALNDCSLVTNDHGHVNPEFIWSFSAPISNAFAHTAKAEIRPSPTPPAFDPDHPNGPPPAAQQQGAAR